MKKLAYAIVCSTSFIVTAFAPHYADRCFGVFMTFTFAILTAMTNEK